MTIEVMMALGDFRFSLFTAAYQTLQKTASYGWATQNRIGRDPALQFTGPEAQTIKMDGVMFPQFNGGSYEVEEMRQMAGKGQPLILVDGKGFSWGKWVITQIEEGQSIFIGPGLARKITWNLTLKSYGEDR